MLDIEYDMVSFDEKNPLSNFAFIVGMKSKEDFFEFWERSEDFPQVLVNFLPVCKDFEGDIISFLQGEEVPVRGFVGVFYPILVQSAEIGRTYRGRYFLFFKSPFYLYFGGTIAIKEVFDFSSVRTFSLKTLLPKEMKPTQPTVVFSFRIPLITVISDLSLLSQKEHYSEEDILESIGRRLNLK